MTRAERTPTADVSRDREDQAAAAFLRRRFGVWDSDDQAAYERRLAEDPHFADALVRVQQAWQATGDHAAAPELMGFREQALARARRVSMRRWLRPDPRARRGWRMAAAVVGIAIALGIVVQLSPFGYLPGSYQTGIGEQHVIELADHSRIALDVQTRLRVRYTRDARVVELTEGQAQFTVARDPKRPFRVEARGHSIVAIGTSFTVECVGQEVRVALLEGKVAVNMVATAASGPAAASVGLRPRAAPATQTTELTAGEEIRVRANGQATVIPKADLAAATAWRQGKIILRGEPLSEAARRLNRYSRLQLEIDDPRLTELVVSGVFETGDTIAFVEAVESYLPVTADYSESDVVRLRYK